MNGNKVGHQNRIEYTQEDDEWLARDRYTDECGYGGTRGEALLELMALKKQKINQLQQEALTNSEDGPAPRNEVRDEISQMFRELRTEPPRVLRRLQPLREWSHEQIKQVFP